ncbi:MAG: hypothetical protein JWN77_2843 [Frankiales bacterium]|jgi:hypothetical protein|nr:hypothetical protein [Frankiales bacterium]
MALAAGVLAHAGGVPEAATVLIPLLVVGAFVVQERRNVRRLREQEETEQVDDPEQRP